MRQHKFEEIKFRTIEKIELPTKKTGIPSCGNKKKRKRLSKYKPTAPKSIESERIDSIGMGGITPMACKPQEGTIENIEERSEGDKLLVVVTEIINDFDDDMIKKPYNKKKVIRIFEKLLISTVKHKYETEQKNLIKALTCMDNNKVKTRKLDYIYKNINIMVFAQIIGYLITLEVLCGKPLDMAKLLIDIGVYCGLKYKDEKEPTQPTETLSKYIIKGKQPEKYYANFGGRWNLIKFVVTKSE